MATPAIDYSALADQARGGAVDYAALADKARGYESHPLDEAPSLLHDFLKNSPVGAVKGLADAIRHPLDTIHGMGQQNQALLDKAKKSYDSGDYTGAAAHFLGYILSPLGGAALDEAGEDFKKGDIKAGLAKTAGIASTMVAAAKAPAVLDAATNPELPGKVAAVARGAGRGAMDMATQPSTYTRAAVPELIGESVGLPRGATAGVIAGSRIIKGAVQGAKAALADRVAAAATTAATETGDELLNSIAQQGIFGKTFKSYADAPANVQHVIRSVAEEMRAPASPSTPDITGTIIAPAESASPATSTAAVPSAQPAGVAIPNNPPTPEVSAPAASSPSIAEMLRDEMLRNGSITAEHLAPPETVDVAPDLKAGLADTMRNQPKGAPKAIADATYAGGVHDDSALAGAVYEAAHRAERAAKLASILHEHGVSAEEMPHIAPEHWEALAKSLGINPPSEATIVETIKQAQLAENQIALHDAVKRLGDSLRKTPKEPVQ